MNQLYILLLVLWSAFNPSDAWRPHGLTTQDPWQTMTESHQTFSTDIYPNVSTNGNTARTEEYGNHTKSDNVPKPNITVYRQTEDREQVIVLCKFAEMFRGTYRRQSIELTVESELKYTIEPLRLHPFYYYYYSQEMRVFLVTVRPPASFTCVQENLRTQTYNYTGSVSDHHEEGASLLYICFSSFIAVGLFIMTAAVIVINIRSKTKDTNSTAVTDNDYGEA
ncbi:uncharacterized protein LOC127963057 [Carassius gibelio]|uniref:uncharacterized protein LOC127963057 n=1 Tax=Carassius gibelio TaxID=101364 RepID=UPI0022774F22|nr:uncharacterized protein LOC127963057 [Carassius gibelio]XP_052418678.1 uncharacterized protein LOC127963057 [Carassius gibelio]